MYMEMLLKPTWSMPDYSLNKQSRESGHIKFYMELLYPTHSSERPKLEIATTHMFFSFTCI